MPACYWHKMIFRHMTVFGLLTTLALSNLQQSPAHLVWCNPCFTKEPIVEPPTKPNTPCLMLPLFHERANNDTTMYHTLRLAIKITEFLNKAGTNSHYWNWRTPVCLLYKIAVEVQGHSGREQVPGDARRHAHRDNGVHYSRWLVSRGWLDRCHR